MKRSLLLFLVFLLSGCASYRVQRDLPYGPGDRQTYDVYQPTDSGAAARPALLAVHGGGYISGDKAWAAGIAERFCPLGYVVIGINYALAPGGAWPAQFEDAKAALAFLRSKDAGLNLRSPIVGLGVSAGAHLVAALHLKSDLRFAVVASGPWDFVHASNAQLDGSLRSLLALPPEAPIPDAARAELSPATWVKPAADMLLIHAREDPLTVYAHATLFEAALRGAGARVELVTIQSDSHGSCWKAATERISRWLTERLDRR